MSYKGSLEGSIKRRPKTLETQVSKSDGGLAKFMSKLDSIESKSAKAKRNATSISDNNGGRIKLNEGKNGRGDIVGNRS